MKLYTRATACLAVIMSALFPTPLAPAATNTVSVAPVAVRYDGWVPQGNFNPQRCSVEVHYGQGESRIKFKGPFAFYPVAELPHSGRSERTLSGESVRLVVFPTSLQFESTSEEGTNTVLFNAGMDPTSAEFWRTVLIIQFTTTVVVDGVERQTALSDCRVNSVTWL